MKIHIRGASEHNLQGVDVDIGDGLTVVTGVSGSGKTSLVFDTLYHEARRRFQEIFTLGSTGSRLAPANVNSITGLGPALAVGQNLLNRNPNSTLATASGLHPFLRLLFARFAERLCPVCSEALSVYSEDDLVEGLVALSQAGPLTVYAPLLRRVPGSHATLLAHLEDNFGLAAIYVDGVPWAGQAPDPALPHDLLLLLARLVSPSTAGEVRTVVRQAQALGSLALTVHSGSASQIFSRAPVCAGCGAWFGELRPVDFNNACLHCHGKGCDRCAGTGLPPQAAAVRWDGLRFTGLLDLSVDEARSRFENSPLPASAARLQSDILRRLEALQRVGLGYLSLDRSSPTLSRGEAQRVRLALALVSRLEDMLHVLDEPTIGLHPADVQRLLPAFRDLAGPVVFVEHDRVAAAGADRAIDLGPGAGIYGGQVVFQGTPAELWRAEIATGRYFSLRSRPQPLQPRPAPQEFLTLRRVYLRNLRGIDVSFPLGCLTVVTGVSGSGKSTLVEDVLVASLSSSSPVGCVSIDGPAVSPLLVDQSPIGRNPRSNPATYTKLADIIRDLYAGVTGLSPSHFSFNRPEGACPVCGGLGAVEVPMRYLPSTWVPCSECDGLRFTDEVLSVPMEFGDRRLSIAGFYSLTIEAALKIFSQEQRMPEADRQSALRILEALSDIGLGYLTLGQPSPSLSGGEGQRVKLARFLGRKSLTRQLLVLDEPSTGLHPQDLSGLLVVLDRLVRHGATIVVVEHNTDIIRAADWVIDLGPGPGPHGGRLLYAGPPSGISGLPGSSTGQALASEGAIAPGGDRRADLTLSAAIAIRGARSHNLKNIAVDIPKGVLTVVTGVSGSGKSSLVRDILETEARRRYLETLSMYERQGVSEGPEAEVDSVSGLGVAISVSPERLVYAARATVGTATGLSHYLAALLSALGERRCLMCGSPMVRGERWSCPSCNETAAIAQPRHFTPTNYSSACLKCNGIGTLVVPQPEKLIIHPKKPLCAGAMYSPGFFPNGYLGKPYNGGYYMLRALAERYGFDPDHTPWNQMAPEAQSAFLYGDPAPMDITYVSRNGQSKTYRQAFPGFYGFIRDWDVGGTYTGTKACPDCGGGRFRPEYLAVTLIGFNVHELGQLPLSQLSEVMDTLPMPAGSLSSIRSGLESVRRRLRFLIQVGLGYLHLERVAGTLSAGEVQRVRLAGLLGSGLTSLTLLLDEPTRGLHPAEVQALLASLVDLTHEGNTVIVVEHDPLVMIRADHLIDMGPGPGRLGGQVVGQGRPEQVARLDTPTGRCLLPLLQPGRPRTIDTFSRRQPSGWLAIHGARANNLRGERVDLPLGVLVGVCGASGSGKSSLIMDTLGRALAPKKQTTSVAYEPVEPGDHDRIEGAPARAILIDQSRAGISSPAAFLDLDRPLRQLFADSEDAAALGVGLEQLSNRCSACNGRGIITVDMAFLPDVHVPCETCRGTGYPDEAWEVHLNGLALPEVYGLTLDEVYDIFGTGERLSRPLLTAREVGLGYLVLRQPGYTLSGGEAQRLKIASELMRKAAPGTLYLLDEPTVGLHLEDVQRLRQVLQRLCGNQDGGWGGGSVIVVEHHPHLLAACDWLVELGPGGGPEGGRVIATGTPEQVAAGGTPIAPYLRDVLEGQP